MDFPMINEINENTNAAKKEILEAMPAAGATSAEVEAAKTAIIGAMPSSAATAQTKAFTNTKFGNLTTKYVTISGCGRILIFSHNSTNTRVYFSVDGGTEVTDSTLYLSSQYMSGPLEIFFEESIKIKAEVDNRLDYIVQT